MVDNTLRNLNMSSPDLAQSSSKLIESSRNVIAMESSRLEKLIQDKKLSNHLDPDRGSIGGMNKELARLSEILQSMQKNTLIEKEQTNTSALWDKNARDNLNWLIEKNFDRIGSGAQETVDRIISLVNRDRTPSNQIQL